MFELEEQREENLERFEHKPRVNQKSREILKTKNYVPIQNRARDVVLQKEVWIKNEKAGIVKKQKLEDEIYLSHCDKGSSKFELAEVGRKRQEWHANKIDNTYYRLQDQVNAVVPIKAKPKLNRKNFSMVNIHNFHDRQTEILERKASTRKMNTVNQTPSFQPYLNTNSLRMASRQKVSKKGFEPLGVSNGEFTSTPKINYNKSQRRKDAEASKSSLKSATRKSSLNRSLSKLLKNEDAANLNKSTSKLPKYEDTVNPKKSTSKPKKSTSNTKKSSSNPKKNTSKNPKHQDAASPKKSTPNLVKYEDKELLIENTSKNPKHEDAANSKKSTPTLVKYEDKELFKENTINIVKYEDAQHPNQTSFPTKPKKLEKKPSNLSNSQSFRRLTTSKSKNQVSVVELPIGHQARMFTTNGSQDYGNFVRINSRSSFNTASNNDHDKSTLHMSNYNSSAVLMPIKTKKTT